MELVDTMILIKKCKSKNYTPVFFCEMSMFEMLKNKNDEQRLKTFVELNAFVKKSHSIMLVSNRNINFFDTRPIIERYNDAMNICKKCASTVSDSFLYFCIMILELVLLQKAYKHLQENDKSKFEIIMALIVEVTNSISKDMRGELINCAFNNSSETLEQELYKKIFNIFIGKINENIGIDYLKLNEISTFATNGIAKANNIKFQKILIDKYIDDIVSFKSNEEITKKVYKAYLNDLLLVSGKLCFNDIIDMHIFFAGYKNKLKVCSNDKKANRLLRTLFNNI